MEDIFGFWDERTLPVPSITWFRMLFFFVFFWVEDIVASVWL